MPELRRMLPSSNALFVFDAAARNGSFTAAAGELNVTQPAVCPLLGALGMKEVMLRICSRGYRDAHTATQARDGTTIIKLADPPEDWVAQYPGVLTSRSGPAKALSFSDYAVVVQAALLGQGITLGWLTVVSHWLLTGTLVPACESLVSTRRICELVYPRNRPIRPVAAEIRDWIIAQMRNDVATI